MSNVKFVKTSSLFKKLFSNYVWDVATDKKVLYLTFDDGPTPEITEQVLAILKQYNAKATFFCIGKNVALYPDIFKRVITDGHAIGNHTQNHIKGWKNNKTTYIENTLIAEEVISENKSQVSNSKSQHKSTNVTLSAVEGSHLKFTVYNSKLFRPPYGQIKPSQGKTLRKLGYKIIMWDVLSYDWEKSTPKEKVLQSVIENAVSGSIIVFHDSVKASENMLYALPKVLKHFSEKGYQFEVLN